jgi:EF-P beta-lysylation protein EpmB
MNNNFEFWTHFAEFLTYLKLPPHPDNLEMNPFSMLVSKHFASKIRKGDWNDPLLRQVLPSATELRQINGFEDDPVGDLDSVQENGILQKYAGRALIIATPACSIHCRFCFRRNFPFHPDPTLPPRLDRWLEKHTDIREVILSGGDPLMLDGETFQTLMNVILKHQSVTTLRIHTRIPVTLPQQLLETENRSYFSCIQMAATQKQVVLVSHVNHPQELDEASSQVFQHLRSVGVTLLNQSVLLAGVNDNADTLVTLSQKLFEQGVLPYYLHQLDHAKGVAHFEVPDIRAIQLINAIRNLLPGYLVPRLVREKPHEGSKQPIHTT